MRVKNFASSSSDFAFSFLPPGFALNPFITRISTYKAVFKHVKERCTYVDD